MTSHRPRHALTVRVSNSPIHFFCGFLKTDCSVVSSTCMSSNRRVRFAEDPLKFSGQAARPVPRPVQTRPVQTPQQPQYLEIVEDQRDEQAALETSSRAEHLENVRLAAQRAHDAMMLARSMRADIRSSNAKMQRLGVKNESTTLSKHDQLLAAAEPNCPNTRTEQHVDPLLDIMKDQDIIAVPMAWISSVFLLNQ